MHNQLFTVIIITYNSPKFVFGAIKSVLNQTCQEFEIIVVNDGSKEDYSEVEEFVKQYPSITYIYKENEGRSIARNTGILKAVGEYICFLDDDDIYLNNNLELLANEIRKNDFPVALLFTLSQKLTENGELILLPLNDPRKHPWGALITYFNCNSSSVCIHNKILQKYKFPEYIHYWEDWDLWLCILKEFPQYPIVKYGVQLTVHDNQTTKLGKRATIDKYFGIKWIYQRHSDVIPFKIYRSWKTENLLSLSLMSLNEGNYLRTLFYLKCCFSVDKKKLTSRFYLSCLGRSLFGIIKKYAVKI